MLSKKKSFWGNLIDHKRENKISGNIIFLISPAIIIGLFLILFAIKKIAPFGGYVYLPSDMYHQYSPFLSEMWHKLHSGGSMLYSWDVGLGTNFVALYAYYLASPLNFLVMLFPHNAIPAVMDAFIVIKMMCASVFFSIYLSRKFNNKNLLISIFTMFYAMSGYVAAYAWDIMWMDCVAMLPLVMLGLERLVEKKRPVLFIISLGLSILFNYYLSIMVVFAVIIYFICLLFTVDVKRENYAIIKRIGLFALSGAVAAGIAAVLLIPEIYAFKLSASSASTFPAKWKAYMEFLEMFSRHLTYAPSYTWLEHYPNIFCGTFIVGLLPLYFISGKIKTRRKIIMGVMLGIFLFSFMFNVPEYIWHGLHFPNCLPARQSFIYIFFILTAGFEVFIHRKTFKIPDILISAVITCVYIATTAYLYIGPKTVADDKSFSYTKELLIINGFFLAVYFVLFLLHLKIKQKKGQMALLLLTMGLAMYECGSHMHETGLSLVNYQGYIKQDDSYAKIKAKLAKLNPEGSFYRMDQDNARTANDGAWYAYRSVNTFSSTSPAGISEFFQTLGTKAAMNSYQRLGATEAVEAFMGQKYVITSRELKDNDPLRKLAMKEGSLYVYENKYTLGLGFAIPEELAAGRPRKGQGVRDAIGYQYSIFEKAAGVKGLFLKNSDITSAGNTSFNINKTGHLYITVNSSQPESITVKVNNDTGEVFSDLKSHNRVLDIGYVKLGDKIDIESKTSLNASSYIMDTDKLGQASDKWNGSALNIDSFSDIKIEGSFTVDSDSRYMFTIPFEKGWEVYIDGVKQDTKEALGAFLSVNVSAGKHKVVLKYFPKGLRSGIVVSLASIGILTTIIILTRRKKVNGGN
ncbi:MAG: YfhO family protein [Clostridiales bacterium]|nr:YfhO family protein [Clostridiales bacterium]